jgi:hypothetical protein
MRRVIVSVLAFVAAVSLLLWMTVKGWGCPVRTVYSVPYVTPTYYPPKVIVAEVLTPVFVPTFTVSYNPAVAAVPVAPVVPVAGGPVAPAAASELSQVLVLLKQLDQRLNSLERGGVAPRPQPEKLKAPKNLPDEDPPGEQVNVGPSRGSLMQTRCAACHTQGKVAEGVPFALVTPDGSEIPLTPEKELKLVKYVYRGKCPPPGNKFGIKPLTDQEYAILTMGQDRGKP